MEVFSEKEILVLKLRLIQERYPVPPGTLPAYSTDMPLEQLLTILASTMTILKLTISYAIRSEYTLCNQSY